MSDDKECFDCREAAEELDAFVRGELPLSDAERMQQHLDDCRGCSDVARLEQAFRDRLRRAGTSCNCPDELRAKIEAMIARQRDSH